MVQSGGAPPTNAFDAVVIGSGINALVAAAQLARGGVHLVEALAAIVTDAGGELLTGADVTRILLGQGRATGVRLADGRLVRARRAVLASVTPRALYEGLFERCRSCGSCPGGPSFPARPCRHADPSGPRRAAPVE